MCIRDRFSNNSSRIAYPTAECVSNSEYSNSNFTTSKGWYWWLRTPDSSYAYVVRYVNSDGALDNGVAYGAVSYTHLDVYKRQEQG